MYRFVTLFLFLPFYPSAYIDLEKMEQTLVLETKQIIIPNYPDAFNPSIIRWNNSILMSFRIRDPITNSTNQFGLIFLDENFNIISEPQLLEIPYDHAFENSEKQDPRLITCGNTTYVVFNDTVKTGSGKIRRMFISKLHFDRVFYAKAPQVFLNFEGENELRNEKNWVPFNYQENLLFAYSLFPHRILHPLFQTTKCETFASSLSIISWDWGEPRGGTQALLVGQTYLAFFHSSKEMKTVQSKGKKISHYFIGAYTFSNNPPFAITKISPEPIFAKTFYQDSDYKTWKPLRVVFPGGFIFDDNYIWITYGRQDHEVWVAKFDKKELLNSLVYVNSIN